MNDPTSTPKDVVRSVATTASVLVNAGADAAKSLFNNPTYKQALSQTMAPSDSRENQQKMERHARTLRVKLMLRRDKPSTLLARHRQKRKDFLTLSEGMLQQIPKDDESDEDTYEDASSTWDLKAGQSAPRDTHYSLFQGFTATIPEVDERIKYVEEHADKLLEGVDPDDSLALATVQEAAAAQASVAAEAAAKLSSTVLPAGISEEEIEKSQNARQLNEFKDEINHKMDLIEIRKGLSSNEINEIDYKIERLYEQRKKVFDIIAQFETDEKFLEDQLNLIESRLQLVKDVAPPAMSTPEPQDKSYDLANSFARIGVSDEETDVDEGDDGYVDIGKENRSILSEGSRNGSRNGNGNGGKGNGSGINTSLHGSPGKSKGGPPGSRGGVRKHKATLQRFYKPGDEIHTFKAHDAPITCFEFDQPFGTLVTASQDNTVRVWDLSRYRCTGLLESHLSTVTCMDMEDNTLVTGSMDATVKLWDVSKVGGGGHASNALTETFEGHVEEVTAVSLHEDNLISSSADKTIRQWDMNTGRCMQTIDVMWATNMSMTQSSFLDDSASGMVSASVTQWDNKQYPLISCLQVYDAALASGGSDGIVRLWDLRSGEIVRQLIGHTGPVNCLEFDDRNIVTGSSDRSVRIWDIRMGSIVDSFAYEHPITSLQFDYSKIVCTDSENVVRVYDRIEKRHWQCGAGLQSHDLNYDHSRDSTIIELARYKQGYMVEGREDGSVGVWAI